MTKRFSVQAYRLTPDDLTLSQPVTTRAILPQDASRTVLGATPAGGRYGVPWARVYEIVRGEDSHYRPIITLIFENGRIVTIAP